MPRGYTRKRRDKPAVISIAEHNWPQLIHELQRAGYSKSSIEAAIPGLTRERIDGILFKRSQPLWQHGDGLLKFIYALRQEKGAEDDS